MAAFDPAEAINFTINGNAYQLWDLEAGEGSGRGMVRESYSRQWQENQGRWRVGIAWGQRQAFAFDMLGSSSGTVYKTPATFYANANWTCKKIDCTGVGAPTSQTGGFIAFPYAIMDVYFGVPEYTNTSLVSEMELDFGSNSIAVDQTAATFSYSGGADVPPSAIPAYRMTTVFGTIKLYNRGSLNTALYVNLVDNVNSVAFQGASIKTVMFKGSRSERMFTAAGLLQYNVSLLFELNPRGWDAIIKPGTGWTTYTFKGGAYPWTISDLNALLV